MGNHIEEKQHPEEWKNFEVKLSHHRPTTCGNTRKQVTLLLRGESTLNVSRAIQERRGSAMPLPTCGVYGEEYDVIQSVEPITPKTS